MIGFLSQSDKNNKVIKYSKKLILIMLLYFYILFLAFKMLRIENYDIKNQENNHQNSFNITKSIIVKPNRNFIFSESDKIFLKQCILPGIVYPKLPRQQLESSPTVEFLASINEKGEIDSLSLLKSSKNHCLDKAIEIGILRCESFPKLNKINQSYKIHIIYKIYEE
ncbi:colicin import membrane protein [Candidatus Kinetoplastibacterium desouzaii TCC079E]|uniref:Colicin import membrane protein n=1 Tax=Candidatus Kinetoplastidibacterium desouzai TCC079E TaxID=1208919 RepID=M1M4J9_9PROT|nr:TonB C-terminal domain-containing protein [Candidatus Kinetoplastibacterium desouzaii]AGF47135.1 colicin import membrane protein [Candidatus Kinetoplastibacterium desouzaii TCC079E]